MITHIIKKTDTLEGIALRYNVSIAKIKKVNKIYSKNVLMSMDKILIPEENDILSPNTPTSSKGDINITTIPNNSNIYYNNNNCNGGGGSQHSSIYNGSIGGSGGGGGGTFSMNNYSMNSAPPSLHQSETNHTLSSFTTTTTTTTTTKTISERGEDSSSVSSLRPTYKRSTSEISNLSEFFENIDRTVMETVNKSNISLPLLIKSQLEVYQDIPTYDPTKDPKSKIFNQ
ncbi:hypothetical protein PIROE2DRAFT_10143 [Piromyces sp. E2]|nr:hypothetical protein PIROE2DRAFT_10143 [Piromyces sp. E2]|eukprot:OUM63357.1 hypothetical protein PIROE2DRAFT_10143 [Piromyces sp. E2]